jgi:hypothetical protein
VTLGNYPAVSLKAARAQAFVLQTEAEAGIDRIELAQQAEADKRVQALAARSVNEILDLYVSTHIEQNLKPGKARNDRIAQLRTHLSNLGEERIKNIRRRNGLHEDLYSI